MKKYIREILDELKVGARRKTAEKPLPQDLSNQELSKNPEERVKQLDYQAQQSERLQTNS